MAYKRMVAPSRSQSCSRRRCHFLCFNRVSCVVGFTYFRMAVTSIRPSANSHSFAVSDDHAVPHDYAVAVANAHGYATNHTDSDPTPRANGYAAADGDSATDSDGNSASHSFAR